LKEGRAKTGAEQSFALIKLKAALASSVHLKGRSFFKVALIGSATFEQLAMKCR
jgi:hypothetical protein